MKRNPEVALLSVLSDVTGYRTYTIQELAWATRLHKSTVRRHLTRLEYEKIVGREYRVGAHSWWITEAGRKRMAIKYGKQKRTYVGR